MAESDARRADALTGGRDEDAGKAFFPAQQVLDALASTRDDGHPRRLEIRDAGDRALSVEVCREADGKLTIGLVDLETLDHTAALRQLARRLAGETDTTRVLELLCAAAERQTGGDGSGVLKSIGNEGELVAAIGLLAPAHGRRFPLLGSLAREVLRTRDVVAVDNFADSGRPLMQVAPDLKVGPMLLAPLIAHDVILGVIVVTRRTGAEPFSSREFARLRVIADYAAVALWKAELLEQAQSADRAKSRFLATVSHELRTPLTALAGYEELLADQVIGPLSDGQRDVLERMRSVTHHLASVIEELLTFSSLDEGHETLRPTDFLAADLVHAAAAVIEPLARQKQLAFHVRVPDTAIRMTSDVDKIRQILVNIAGNAVKFTDAGDVWLELSRANGDVRFTVRDTGMGIARRDLERLFRPFAQLDTGLTRRHGGTGLGLYISRRIAEMLGGRIEVDSEPGCGSTFTLVLAADE